MTASERKGPTSAPIPPPGDFTFEEFAVQPEYVEVNRGLVRRLYTTLPQRFVHLDVATGTGLVPKLLREEVMRSVGGENAKRGTVIGVDPNPVQLGIAERTWPGSGWKIPISFLRAEGYGQDAVKIVRAFGYSQVDSASIHDAIHEIPDEFKQEVIDSMVKTLKRGGVFTMNSAFTTEGMANDAMKWGKWKMEALKIFGGRRDKSLPAPIIHTPNEYREMLEDAGLTVEHDEVIKIQMTRKSLEAISRYPAFIEGVFSDMIGQEDFSLEEKSAALIQALNQLGIETLSRNWHELLAVKPSNGQRP